LKVLVMTYATSQQLGNASKKNVTDGDGADMGVGDGAEEGVLIAVEAVGEFEA
jgi:hypothetical protein